MRVCSPRVALVISLVLVTVAPAAWGQVLGSVTLNPSSVSAFPTQTTQSIGVTLTFSGPAKGGAGTMLATGMPTGVTTVPSPISYTAAAGATGATTSFQFSIASGTTPGTYPITVTDQSNGAGSGTVTLVVNAPSITATATPNPVTLTIGGAAQNVVVTTSPDPGFNAPTISYSFGGFPTFIVNNGPQTSSLSTFGYTQATFSFSLGAGAAPGTYAGTLSATWGTTTVFTKNFPYTVVIAQPDIAASFSQAVLPVCAGQSAGDTIQLSPVNGYSGTPTLTFTTIPAGITITPSPLPGVKMPPAASIPINVAAGAGATSGVAVLNITDRLVGINKNIQLQINVVNPDFTPAVTPTSIALTAGGASQNISASITPNACLAANVSVGASGMPAGMTIATIPSTITAPNFAPVTLAVQAAASTAPGTYPITFTFVSGTITHTATAQVSVSAAPDFTLNLNPTALTIQAGSSSATNATINAINGFTGTVTVTAPISPGVTFSPSSFTLAPGAVQNVNIAVQAASTTGPRSLQFTATAPGVSGTRTATLSLSITAGPDFTLTATPVSASIPAGGTLSPVTIAAIGANNFSGAISVTAPSIPGITITPSTFTIVPGTAGQQVSVAVAGTVTPQPYTLTFTGTSPTITGTRSATVQLTVTSPPGFILTLTPNSLTIPAGGSASVTAGVVPLNGFNGTVSVTAPTVPGVTFTPSSFDLVPGATKVVTIDVDPSTAAGSLGALSFTATSPGIVNGAGASVSITVSARPDFSIAADPTAVTVRAGGSTQVKLTAQGVNGYTGAVTVTAPALAGLSFSPATFTIPVGGSQVVTINASNAAAGHGAIQVTFNAGGVAPAAAHTATVVVTVLPPLPLLTAASPPAVVAGAQSVAIRVAGDFLQTGAQFHSSDPALTIEGSNVLTTQLADVRVSVRSGATPGPRDLTVTNPDGGVSSQPVTILVYPPGAIAAPLDVTAAAIVFPARGTMISPDEAVYPRGLLATSGTGTIVGSWQFDGVPFDRFVVNATGGMPVEVRTNIAIPTSFAGGHTLGLVIETPRHFVSPTIEIIDAVDRVSRLTLLAPRDGAVIRGPEQTFRWSMVPNCSGYDIEVALTGASNVPDALTPMAKFHVANAEWRPSARDIADIGPGIHRWRVRPRCAGDTELEPSAWQRIAILPDHVNVTLLPMTTNDRGARVVRWNSGVTGLLYRVEFLAPDGNIIFSALTSQTEYTLPQALPAGTAVRVSAIGPDGHVLGTSTSSPLARKSGREAYQLVQETLIEIGAVEPADGATINVTQPHIAAQWKGAAKPDQITLLVDNTDITQVATVTPTSIAYDSLIALAPGPHTAALAVAGNIKRWTFTIAVPEGAQPAEAAPAPPAQEPRGDWVIAPVGTVTLVHDATNEARTQFSALTDLNAAGLANKGTGDVSLKHDFENDKTVQESRNWTTEVGAHQGAAVSERLRFGYTPPDFFDQAQFLSAGLPRGGIQASLVLPKGVASYYQTFTQRPAGLVTGLFGPEQKLKALAYQIPVSEKWDFRLFGLRVQEGPDFNASGGVNSVGGVGRAAGIFARYTLGATVNAIMEVARGDFKPNAGSDEARRKGNAFRVGVNGMRGTITYAANVRRTEADFINPANRGMTPGGVPDRTAVDATVGKTIGLSSVTLQLRHQFDGNTSGLTVPRTRETGGTASVMTMFGQHVSFAVSGNLTKDKGEEKPDIALPRADRTQSGLSGTLSEFFGRYNFTQTVTRQLLRDHVNDMSDQTITSSTLTAGGQFSTFFNLQACLTGTRTGSSPIVGTTDQYMASLQPMIMIPAIFLSFQPRASYSTSKNDLIENKSTTQQYAALVTFGPQWLNQVFAVQLSADWSKNSFSGETEPAKFVHRYVATINLHWRAGYGPAYTSGVMPPGMMQVAAPNPSASAPGPTH